ncbi:uncharacterized protein BO72DRAFT_509952 [Aspergillus fijiensis CBS 313.89]|uniref:MFS general substrate transporter n=1 Tax=Aspergillus fijiensis CBS 313.89 TaxID=1448319 RepID=A0A8G1RRX1_9EURO|nr:uncharacterized protein BO72DRAFT_509952 [Aspergillus fijiensis CBS 313.89]RAK77168.1 hypothetical protein BO72DRAFT_509952 [Aspergillus fijiensis CBS 313.89]
MARHNVPSRSTRVLLPLLLTAFLFFLGENIQSGPRTQIYESILCDQILPNNATTPLSSARCKDKAVQEELAFLKGTERVLGAIPTILVIPWSIFAERYGRCLSLRLALFGVLCEEAWSFLICWFSNTFPIRLILLAPVFEMIGGGPGIIITMIHILAAETATEEKRTTTFFFIRAMAIAAAVLALLGSSLLMSHHVWVPWLLGLFCLLLAILTTPSELHPTTSQNPPDEHTALNPGQYLDDHTSTVSQESGSSTKEPASIRSRLVQTTQQLHQGARVVYGNTSLVILLGMSFLGQLGEDSLPMALLLYISKRYNWEFARANFLWSLGEAVRFVCLIVLLPRISRMLLSRAGSTTYKTDFAIALASATMLSLGTLLLGLGVSIPISTIGMLALSTSSYIRSSGNLVYAGVILISATGGLNSALRSLVTMTISSEDISVVYSIFTILHVLSTSLAGPIYSGAFALGLQFGVEYTGLPFIVAAALVGLSLPMFFLVRPRGDYELVTG